MKKQRLLKLADLLQADAENENGIKFNLNWFVKPEDIDNPKLDCSTEACAVGLACLSGAFKRSGLGWIVSHGIEIIPTFEGRSGSEATEKFFGITDREFSFLFMPGHYAAGNIGAKAERAVAKRIRDFVAGKVSL